MKRVVCLDPATAAGLDLLCARRGLDLSQAILESLVAYLRA